MINHRGTEDTEQGDQRIYAFTKAKDHQDKKKDAS